MRVISLLVAILSFALVSGSASALPGAVIDPVPKEFDCSKLNGEPANRIDFTYPVGDCNIGDFEYCECSITNDRPPIYTDCGKPESQSFSSDEKLPTRDFRCYCLMERGAMVVKCGQIILPDIERVIGLF